jgi:hypothetical protein
MAQNIPIGTWRSHISFNSIHTISPGANRVYAASANGVVIVHKSDNSITTLTKLNGLSGTDITHVAVDEARQQVLVSYSDGNLDIIRANEIVNFDRLKNSTIVTGSKRINQVMVHNTLAYLATDYGVVVFDLNQREVKETYRDLGVSGAPLKIYQTVFKEDSIFLATANGVLAGDLTDNLLDFSKWKRFNTGAFNGMVPFITAFNNTLFAAVTGSGIYKYGNGSWLLEAYLQNLTYKNVIGGNSFLLVTEDAALWKVNTSGEAAMISAEKIIAPIVALEDAQGKLWIGDQRNGLVSDNTGNFESYIPNGPTFSKSFRLKYAQRIDYGNKDMMYVVSGGADANYLPAQNNEYLNVFLNGTWISQPTYTNQNLTDVDFLPPSKVYLSSYGYGLQLIHESQGQEFFDHTNSTLVNNRISAIESSQDGLWVAEYGVPKPLHLFNPADNSWQSFSLPYQFPVEIKVDRLGHVWMVNNPAAGGGIVVFNKETNQHVYLTEATGSGALPNRSVYAVAMDRDGQVWIGTAAGVAYFPDPSRIFSGGATAVKPIFENRFLLRDERVISIAVDGGNRKWMGTERGVWLFDPFGESQAYNFNTENSPLLSNRVLDIEINQQSGEVFFLSESGVVSFRADATASDNRFRNVRIFPNPVTSRFNGLVGISGLSTDATVKITDVSGKLVWQTYAHGGTATWNVRDYNGNRSATGIYLVFSVAEDGRESVVGKIAVVD